MFSVLLAFAALIVLLATMIGAYTCVAFLATCAVGRLLSLTGRRRKR